MNRFFTRLLRRILVTAGVAALAVAAGLYFIHGKAEATTPAAATAPPPDVTVKTLALEKVRLWTEFSGRMHAVDYAEIRPEVSGRITEVRFVDGQTVKAGDILFVIDPRPYTAAVERAEADLTSALSKLQLAQSDQTRAAGLIVTHAIAQSELERYNDAQRAADAARQAAEAVLAQAKLDLEHAYVAAPISGRVSRAEITVGNLVQGGAGAPVLTSIVSNDGIYADFEVDEQTYLQTIRRTAYGNAQEGRIPVELVLPVDGDKVCQGFIQSFDNRIDVTSGTIRARARFANEDGLLVPGMFVTVRLAGSRENDALLVPERAVSFDQSKKFVYVVDAANKVGYREVELGRQVRGRRVVEKGLQPGDRVIVDGVQHVRPDAVVTAKEAAPDRDLAAGGD